jgi:hypothetical protein
MRKKSLDLLVQIWSVVCLVSLHHLSYKDHRDQLHHQCHNDLSVHLFRLHRLDNRQICEKVRSLKNQNGISKLISPLRAVLWTYLFLFFCPFFFCFIMPSYAHLYPLKHLFTLTITRLFQVHSHTHAKNKSYNSSPLYVCIFCIILLLQSYQAHSF